MWGYYILRDRLPFFTLLLLVIRNYTTPRLDDLLNFFALIPVAFILWVSYCYLLGYLADTPIYEIMNMRWTYAAPIEWGLFTVIIFILMVYRLKDIITASNIAIQASSVGGWLYEIPIFIYWGSPIFRTNDSYVFYISFQILSLPVLYYLLRTNGWIPDNNTDIATIIYCLFTLAASIFIDTRMAITEALGNWWLRLPTMILLAIWINGIPETPT